MVEIDWGRFPWGEDGNFDPQEAKDRALWQQIGQEPNPLTPDEEARNRRLICIAFLKANDAWSPRLENEPSKRLEELAAPYVDKLAETLIAKGFTFTSPSQSTKPEDN